MGNSPHESWGGGPQPPELPKGTQEYIERDPRLRELAKNPEQLQVISDIFEKNQNILSKTDNLTEHARLWNESLKEYGQMTQDGRKFSVLSESDVDGLTRQEKKAYYAWKNQQLDATIVSKRTEGQQLDATIVSEDKANEGRKATINQIPNLDKINVEVQGINKLLSPKDQSFVSTELQKAKSGSDNAAITELKRQGATPADIQSGKYDSYISASIIIENANKLEASKDPAFQKSLRELQSLGIPVRVQPDFQSVSAHMDGRFQGGERLNAIKSTMRDDLARGGYSSVHYDGIGERYTMIGKDGTQKEITLDKPPLSRIRSGNLALSREIPKEDENSQKRRELQESYKKNGEKAAELRIHPTPSEDIQENQKIQDLYSQTLSRSLPVENRIEALEHLKNTTRTRREKIENTPKENIQFDQMEKMGNEIGSLREEERTLDKLTTIYQAERNIIEQSQNIPPPKGDTWDIDAKRSLSLFHELGFGRLGQDGFDEFIEAWNTQNKNQQAYSLHLESTPKIDNLQESALRTFVYKKFQSDGTTPQEKFQSLRTHLTDSNFIQQHWNTPEKRAKFLFESPQSEGT